MLSLWFIFRIQFQHDSELSELLVALYAKFGWSESLPFTSNTGGMDIIGLH